MYVVGGFNSLLLSDVLVYTSPSCSAFSSQATCAQAWPGILCMWNSTLEACLPWGSSGVGADQPALCNTHSCRCRRQCCSVGANLQQKRFFFRVRARR